MDSGEEKDEYHSDSSSSSSSNSRSFVKLNHNSTPQSTPPQQGFTDNYPKIASTSSPATNNNQPSSANAAADIDKDEHLEEINILLLGETGVGKSTFINAFLNYLSFDSLSEAEKQDLNYLIPAKFSVANDDYDDQCVITIGEHDNECSKTGQSATQKAKSYVFYVSNYRIRLIDTPGIADTRGIDKDNENFDNMLSYIAEFKELHAICVLMKPNNARLTVLFEYCIKQLLSRLQKSASNNMIFLFTNSRSTFYRPGDTLPALKEILDEIKSKPPHVDIKFKKENVFCMDNEAFRFLAALKHDVHFNDYEKEDFSRSWERSSNECWRMLKYVVGVEEDLGLKPHKIQDTVSVNEARRLIIRLSQPLADVAKLIQDNITILQRHQDTVKSNENNLEELKKNLYIPVVNVRSEQLPQPRTVCTAAGCIETHEVNGVQFIHYKQLCHNPCYLDNVPKEIIGSPELIECYAMGGTQNCQECGCSYLVHMHIYYITSTYTDKIVNKNVQSQIDTERDATNLVKIQVKELENRKQEYELEEKTITKVTAKFAHFLQNNAITVYNDAYEGYLKYLIDREESFGNNSDFSRIKHHKRLLAEYQEEKRILNDALTQARSADANIASTVTAEDIQQAVKDLYSLKHTGAKISELYDKQAQARKHEMAHEQEYVHRKTYYKNYLKFIKIFK